MYSCISMLKYWWVVYCALLLAALPAQAAITRVSFTGTNANSNQITITRPASLLVGDVMLSQIAARQSGVTITAPAGWVLVPGINPIVGTNIRQAIYYKVVAGAEPANYTWLFSSSQRVAGSVTAYREVSTSNPIDVYGGQANASSTSITAPSVTTTMANTMVVGFFGLTRGNGITSPAGMTAGYATNAGGATGIAVRSANVLQAVAGATGNKVATTSTGSTNIGQLVALRPAPIPDPYLEYRMEEASWNGTVSEVIDSSGFARNGTAVGTAQTTASGRICRGATIPNNTTAAAISAINSGIDVNTVGNQGGITFWYRLAETWGTNNRQLFDATVANNRWFFLTKRSNRQLRFVFTDSSNSNIALNYTAPNYAANTWVHIGVSWNLTANRYYLYVNGVQVASSSTVSSGALNNTIGTLYIGDNRSAFVGSNGTGNSANGTIDEFRLYNSAITSSVAARDFALTRACTTLDHIRLEHDGAGVTCAPEMVAVKACVDVTCSALSTSPATVTLSGTGWATNPITFTGSTTVNLSITAPSTFTLGTSAVTPTPSGTSPVCINSSGGVACNLIFADTGFIFSTIPTQTAGVTSGNVTIQAVKKSDNSAACTGVFSGNVAIDMASQCIDPTTCNGKQVTINATTIANNPASGIGSYTPVLLNFGGSSTAIFTLNYPDVGNMSLSARYALGGGNFMTGASNTFVVKPFGFSVTGIQRTADGFANPAAGSAAGSKFIHAGESFTATVTAIAQGGAATPNYGRETAPEGVLLTPSIVLPAAGANPALTNGTVSSFTNGGSTPTNLAWDEVGIITLTPSVGDGDYLGAGNTTGTTTGNIGRFVPHHFAALGEVTPACVSGAFTYMAQNFTLSKVGSSPLTAEMLEARNLGDTKTANYTGAFAPGLVSFGLENADNGTDLSARLTAPGSWSAGVYTLSSTNAVFSRPVSTAPDTTWGAFEQLEMGITAADTDVTTTPRVVGADMNPAAVGCGTGCTYKKITVVGGTKMRYGRARLNNAHGSELLPLPVPIKAQYYNGSGFVTNSLDSCTTFTIPVSGSPCTTAACVWGDLTLTQVTLDADKTNVTISNNPLLSGVSQFNLSAPLPVGTRGAVDLTLNVPAWLEFNWTGVVGDPKSRATFGLHRKADQFIYQRENY
ncbi:MAG: LamG domain-containing protein [Burkholderiales bacterium]|nr:LamG domain-containing protein [Burkholderiales bacterium]